MALDSDGTLVTTGRLSYGSGQLESNLRSHSPTTTGLVVGSLSRLKPAGSNQMSRSVRVKKKLTKDSLGTSKRAKLSYGPDCTEVTDDVSLDCLVTGTIS